MLQRHEQDAFDLLGIKPGSDAATVRKAWRALVRTYHPDLAKSDPKAANTRLAEINAAFDLLTKLETAPADPEQPTQAAPDGPRQARRAAQASRRRKQAREHAQEQAAARAKAADIAAQRRAADEAERRAAADRAAARSRAIRPVARPATAEDAVQRLARLSFERARRAFSAQPQKHTKLAFA